MRSYNKTSNIIGNGSWEKGPWIRAHMWDFVTLTPVCHYNDVIMDVIASQITTLTIVDPTVSSGPYQRKHQSFASLAFVRGIHRGPVPGTGEFPAQMASSAELVSIWWRHHVPQNGTRTSGDSLLIAKQKNICKTFLLFWIYGIRSRRSDTSFT